MSCPYKKFDAMRQCEYCKVTDAKIDGVTMCDIAFSYCTDYSEQQRKKVQRSAGSLKKKGAVQ